MNIFLVGTELLKMFFPVIPIYMGLIFCFNLVSYFAFRG